MRAPAQSADCLLEGLRMQGCAWWAGGMSDRIICFRHCRPCRRAIHGMVISASVLGYRWLHLGTLSDILGVRRAEYMESSCAGATVREAACGRTLKLYKVR